MSFQKYFGDNQIILPDSYEPFCWDNKHLWLLTLFCLVVNTNSIKQMEDSLKLSNKERHGKRMDFNFLDKFNWPENPGATVFDEVGYSYFHAIQSFGGNVIKRSIETLKDIAKNTSHNWIYEPINKLEEIEQWKIKFYDNLQRYLPTEHWNKREFRREVVSVYYKYIQEYNQAFSKLIPQENRVENIFNESIEELIKRGEGHYIEFKGSLEYDINKKQHNKDLNKECLKAIAEFLNSEGGVLLIGVKDDKTVFGIEQDLKVCHKNDQDGFELKLRELIHNYLKPLPYNKIYCIFEKINQSMVCRVNIKPIGCSQIISLEDNIYVRDGNRKLNLKAPAEIVNWIQQRNKTQ